MHPFTRDLLKSVHGFTLVETMFALLISSLLFIGAYQVLKGTTQTSVKVTNRTAVEKQVTHALDLFASDIHISGSNPTFTSGFKGNDTTFCIWSEGFCSTATPNPYKPYGIWSRVGSEPPISTTNRNLVRLYSWRNPDHTATFPSYAGELVLWHLGDGDGDNVKNDLIRSDQSINALNHQVVAHNLDEATISFYASSGQFLCSIKVTDGDRVITGTCDDFQVSLVKLDLKYTPPGSATTVTVSESARKWVTLQPTPTPTPTPAPTGTPSGSCETTTTGSSTYGCCFAVDCTLAEPYVRWLNCNESWVYDTPDNPINITFDCTPDQCVWADPSSCNLGGPTVTPTSGPTATPTSTPTRTPTSTPTPTRTPTRTPTPSTINGCCCFFYGSNPFVEIGVVVACGDSRTICSTTCNCGGGGSCSNWDETAQSDCSIGAAPGMINKHCVNDATPTPAPTNTPKAKSSARYKESIENLLLHETINHFEILASVYGKESVSQQTITMGIALVQQLIRSSTVNPETPALRLLSKLRPVTFMWKESHREDVGLIAEEVFKVAPRFVYFNENHQIEGVLYFDFRPLLREAIDDAYLQLHGKRASSVRRVEFLLQSVRQFSQTILY
jgi:type II secretory pathway pseudopilin PulG